MNYSNYRLHQVSKKSYKPNSWAFQEGVFVTPQKKYIARIKDHRGYVTLSQHNTEEEAKKAYEDFMLNKQ